MKLETKLSFWDKLAIHLAAVFAQWRVILLQMAIIGVWFFWNPFHDPARGRLDLSISIWTLFLDNVIILATAQTTKLQNKHLLSQNKLIENQIKFLEDERDVHAEIIQTQKQIIEILNGQQRLNP